MDFKDAKYFASHVDDDVGNFMQTIFMKCDSVTIDVYK